MSLSMLVLNRKAKFLLSCKIFLDLGVCLSIKKKNECLTYSLDSALIDTLNIQPFEILQNNHLCN